MTAAVILGGFALGTEALAGEEDLTPPTVSITSPVGGVVSAGQLTVSWNYTSIVPRAQVSYRVVLSLNESGAVVYDSGTVASANNYHTTSYSLIAATGYVITVYVSDIFFTSSPAFAAVFTDDSDPVASITPLGSVGTVYEIGINGLGFMLADMVPEQGQENHYQRQLVQVAAPRFSTGDTPFSEAFDRYTFLGFGDFSGGAGQQYRDRPDSDQTRYLDSTGVNPFVRGRLSLLPAMTRGASSAFSPAIPDMVVPTTTSNRIAYLTASAEVTFLDDAGATTAVATPANVASFTPVGGVTDKWYWATAAGSIYSTSGSGGVHTLLASSLTDVIYQIEWIGDRLAGFQRNNTTSKTSFTTWAVGTTSATEEVAGGRLIVADGQQGDITWGGGMVYFSAGSSIYGWTIGSTEAPTELFKVPTGGFVSSLLYVDGNLFAWVWRWKTGLKKRATVYRFAIQNQTTLSPSIVCRLGTDDAIDYGTGGFATDGERVIFPWNQMIDSDTSGVGCVDLTTGGYCKWQYQNENAAGSVLHVVNWVKGWAFHVDGVGVYTQSGSQLTAGSLKTSMVDLDSDLEKIADRISVGVNRFTDVSQSVTMDYTSDSGNSYIPISGVNLAGTGSAPNVQDFTWGKRFRTVGLRINLNNLGTDVYHEKTVVEMHAATVADMVIVVPVNCADAITSLSGTPLASDNGPGAGAARARFLESLVLTRILFQDIDWQATRASQVYEVVGCNIDPSINVRNPVAGRALQRQVAVLTLRRRYA